MSDFLCSHGWSIRYCFPCFTAHLIAQLKGPRDMGMLAIKPDQIPDAVADSMREFFHTRGDAQRAIAAALSAWPGMECRPTFGPSRIILPLTEKQDDKA